MIISYINFYSNFQDDKWFEECSCHISYHDSQIYNSQGSCEGYNENISSNNDIII